MKFRTKALCISFGGMLFISQNIFSTAIEENVGQDFFPSSRKADSPSTRPVEPPNFEAKLAQLNGKNLSGYSISREVYDLIESRVGRDNQRPFVFKAGPQITFVDEIDLSK